MLLSAFNLWMMEYFFVLELARPFVILTALRNGGRAPRERLKQTFLKWLPYLAVFVLAVLSRLFIFNNQIYGFGIRDEFISDPLSVFISLLQQALTSLWTVGGAAWAQVFHFPNPATDGPRVSGLYAGVVLLCGGLAFLSMSLRRRGDQFSRSEKLADLQHEKTGQENWWIIGLGLVFLLLGGPPFWLTGVPISLGFPANRALLSFMLGVSLVLAGVLELIPPRIRVVIASILIALAAGRQFLWANDFRADWAAHKQFFWQMTWRAPGLEPDTILFTNEELSYYADNSLGAALNWIYAPDNHSERVDYLLLYPTNRLGGSLPALLPDTPVEFSFLAGEFAGNTSKSAAFYYNPPGCLRLLDADIDPYNRLIPADSLMRDAAILSSSLPIMEAESKARMPDVYKPEPEHGWCYYFEKADLARQNKDWKRVTELGDIALALDDHPNDPIERFVFIEGYAHEGDWEKAAELSMDSYRVSKEYLGPLLCRLWARIDQDVPESSVKTETLIQIETFFTCARE